MRSEPCQITCSSKNEKAIRGNVFVFSRWLAGFPMIYSAFPKRDLNKPHLNLISKCLVVSPSLLNYIRGILGNSNKISIYPKKCFIYGLLRRCDFSLQIRWFCCGKGIRGIDRGLSGLLFKSVNIISITTRLRCSIQSTRVCFQSNLKFSIFLKPYVNKQTSLNCILNRIILDSRTVLCHPLKVVIYSRDRERFQLKTFVVKSAATSNIFQSKYIPATNDKRLKILTGRHETSTASFYCFLISFRFESSWKSILRAWQRRELHQHC